MMYTLRKTSAHFLNKCIFVGTHEDCLEAKRLIHNYYVNDCCVDVELYVEPLPIAGSEQAYITKVLDNKINFDYGM